MARTKGITGFLFRENKGWVFVATGPVSDAKVKQIEEYWATVSDLPIVVFSQSLLLLDGEGRVNIREVTFAA